MVKLLLIQKLKRKVIRKKRPGCRTAKVNTNGSFLVSNLRPGAAIVNISNKSSTNEVTTTIVAGKVTELRNIDFGQQSLKG